ncbi:MAG: glycoside hydrolase family 3 N-terminal domain-containing protein [bacterium]
MIAQKINWRFFLVVIVLVIIFIGKTLTNEPKEASLTDEKLKEEIGQMIMIGFRGTEAPENSDIYKIIKDVKIGGAAFSDYDVPSNSFPRNIISPDQTKKLISDLQKYSADNLFIAIDAEGGNINRLKKQYGFLPILSPEEMGQDKTLATVEKESAKLAEELMDMGFNMNFAPVVDLNINPKNPIIGALGRSFSSDQEEVVNQSRVFIESHLKNNIIAVAKHFPGQGSAIKDSHLGIADVTDTYKKEELFPYQKLNNEGMLNAVMVGHIADKKIDSNYPATLSKIFLQDILRGQIGFKGVIISDDMQMAAISDNYKGFDEAIIMAVNAGNDIIYFFNNSPSGYDKDMAYKVRDAIFNAVKENKIKEKRITESYNRILSLKKQFKIIQSAAEIRAKNFELLGVPDTFTFGEALDIAKYVEGITKVRPAFLLGILQEELTLEKFDLCYLTNLNTGEGVRAIDGKILQKTMHPKRDIPGFLAITKELGKDPLKTLVTCPMSFGWGGAMGPADFIPSTWLLYKNQIERITGKPADPWNINDAFLAAGLYLSDSGAASKTRDKEWQAAMIYFSGSANSPYTWYADDALKIADKLERNIIDLEK